MLTDPPRLLLTTDAVGGVWRYSLDLAGALSRDGIETVVVVVGPPPSAEQSQEAAGLPCTQLVVAGGELDWMAETEADFLSSANRVLELAKDLGPSSIHLHAPSFAVVDCWPTPIVTMAHSCTTTWWRAVRGANPGPESAWRTRLTRAGLMAADAVIAPSHSFASALRDAHALSRPIEVIHNGSDAPIGRPNPRQDAILIVGRLWDQGKNVSLLDNVAGLIDVPFRAVGQVCSPAGERVSFENLQILGEIPPCRLFGLYEKTAIFASAAHYEPFGLAVLEAARAGCALVLSDIPTFRELWAGAAEFVPVDDVDGWASVLRSLLAMPAKREAQAARAQARAVHYSVAVTARQTWRVHASLGHRAPTVLQAGSCVS